MKRTHITLFLTAFTLLVLTAACTGLNTAGNEYSIPIYNKDPDLGITAVPSEMGDAYVNTFDRYTEIKTPSDGKIRIVAQNRISNEQMLRARGILLHYLSDVHGSLYGSTKDDLADKMAENNAILTLLNYRDDGSNRTQVDGQPLYEEELPVVGGEWYMNNMYEEHRDAAFEEILHLVHDYGIGVDGKGGNPGALPKYQKEIRKAEENALLKIWAVGMDPQKGWLLELTRENSVTQEYLASVVDSWYGCWGAWIDASIPESKQRGMWGFYLPKTRDEVFTEDPEGARIVQMFFPEYLNYNVRIDPEFSGSFSMRFNSSLPYTHKSRYLKDISLTGSLDSNIIVNSYDNSITGNSGYNKVLLSGKKSEYLIEILLDSVIVADCVALRDGKNTLKDVEELVFADGSLKL